MQTKFTLHHSYKDFTPGVSTLHTNSLIPYSAQGSIGCILPFLLFTVCLLAMSTSRLYYQIVVPLLFQHFSQTTTAQVVNCEMQETKQYGYIPYLTYNYSWNDQSWVDRKRIYSYDTDSCEDYLNQHVSIRVLEPDPAQTVLIATESSQLNGEILGSILMGVFSIYGSYTFLYWIFLQLRAEINYPRLVDSRTLLEGEIIRVHGYTPNKSNAYLVKVRYDFETPRKKRLTGWAEARRDDLKDKPLPPIGTPVAVLYADDHAHMML